jgi:ERF superfamily
VVTRLMHVSAQWIESSLQIPDGLERQELGKTVTYLRRYTTMAMLGIHPDEDDDAAPTEEKPRAAPREAPAPQEEDERERLVLLHGLFSVVKACELNEDALREKIKQLFHQPIRFKDLSTAYIKTLIEYYQGVKRSMEPPKTFDEQPNGGDQRPPVSSSSSAHTLEMKGKPVPIAFIDVRKVEIPTPEVDEKGKVTRAWMDLLPLRAEALGCIELCANMMKRTPSMTVKQYRDCWEVMRHATPEKAQEVPEHG